MIKLRTALAGLLALFVASAAVAQTFPTVPAQTVIGRLGTPGTTGPAQAIPFATLSAQLNTITSAVTPISSCTDKALIYDSGGKITCLTTANNGVLTTDGSGNPSITTSIALNGATAIGAGQISGLNTQNGFTRWMLSNLSSGSGASTAYVLENDVGRSDLELYSSTFSNTLFRNRLALVGSSLHAGLLFTTVGAGTIDLAILNSKVATVTSTYIGSTIAGTAANPSLVVGSAGYGFYQPGVNQLGMSVGGAVVLDYGITTANTFTLGAGFIGQNKIVSTFATGGVGYATGAGGSATQGAGSGKSTTVAFNAVSGAITMNNAALAAGTIVSFPFTNTAIAATDVLILNHISGGTPGSYTLNARAGAGSATIDIRNNTAGSLSEAIVIQFAVIKAVIN